mgnify:CR=1 FL=1
MLLKGIEKEDSFSIFLSFYKPSGFLCNVYRKSGKSIDGKTKK